MSDITLAPNTEIIAQKKVTFKVTDVNFGVIARNWATGEHNVVLQGQAGTLVVYPVEANKSKAVLDAEAIILKQEGIIFKEAAESGNINNG